tara:strand:- start:448 stop:747 length:300 start_codon:yes stop_codon:yes gene_type:complete
MLEITNNKKTRIMTFTKQELLEIENFDYAEAVRSANEDIFIEEHAYQATVKKKPLTKRAKKELKNLSLSLQNHGFARMEQMMAEERGQNADYNQLINRR